MPRSRPSDRETPTGPDHLAFLLSPVGAHSSAQFAERLEPLGLKPPHVGILRLIAQLDGLSQQALGEEPMIVFPTLGRIVLAEVVIDAIDPDDGQILGAVVLIPGGLGRSAGHGRHLESVESYRVRLVLDFRAALPTAGR